MRRVRLGSRAPPRRGGRAAGASPCGDIERVRAEWPGPRRSGRPPFSRLTPGIESNAGCSDDCVCRTLAPGLSACCWVGACSPAELPRPVRTLPPLSCVPSRRPRAACARARPTPPRAATAPPSWKDGGSWERWRRPRGGCRRPGRRSATRPLRGRNGPCAPVPGRIASPRRSRAVATDGAQAPGDGRAGPRVPQPGRDADPGPALLARGRALREGGRGRPRLSAGSVLAGRRPLQRAALRRGRRAPRPRARGQPAGRRSAAHAGDGLAQHRGLRQGRRAAARRPRARRGSLAAVRLRPRPGAHRTHDGSTIGLRQAARPARRFRRGEGGAGPGQRPAGRLRLGHPGAHAGPPTSRPTWRRPTRRWASST